MLDYLTMRDKVKGFKENGYAEVYTEQDSKDFSIILQRLNIKFKCKHNFLPMCECWYFEKC